MKNRFENLDKLIFLLIITVSIATILSFSKYRGTAASTNTTKIALMAENVDFSIDVTEAGYPGFSKVYPIEITNKLDGKICEVSQKYNLTLKQQTEENIPLSVELFEDSKCLSKMVDDNGDGTYESNNFSFNAGVESSKTFYLKVTWPEDKNSDYYSLEINYLKLDFVITQKD